MKKIFSILLLTLALALILGCAWNAASITANRPGDPKYEPSPLNRGMRTVPVWLESDREANLAALARASLYVSSRLGLSDTPFSFFEGPRYYMEAAAEQRTTFPEQRFLSASTPVTRELVLATLYRCGGKGLESINVIEEIPGYGPSDEYWESVLAMYEAGVYVGSDEYGTLDPQGTMTNGELWEIAQRMANPEQRLHVTLESRKVEEEIVYGQSGAGRDLMAYRYGDGENVLVMAFAIHGWEDNWDRDGQMLVDTAELVRQALDEHYWDLVDAGNWSVYVLPCLNPDGLLDGVSCNGDGRRTTHRYNWEGELVEGGIDMNRCFPYIFYSRYDSRNFNGTKALQAPEAQALAEFVQSVQGSANNVLIDTHGWYSQIIVSGGWGCPIYEAFSANFPTCYYTGLRGSAGYFSAWAAYVLGYDAALFEFPYVPNEEVFHAYSLDEKYVNSVLYLLENYEK